MRNLLSREFILLFLLAMCSNCYIAVYYCLEQWLEGLAVSPNWRGVLLAALFAMVFLFRPLASWLLLRADKLPAMLVSIAVSSCTMLAYPFVPAEHVIGAVLVLRVVQGIALAVYSSCTVAVLVTCIPPGQSARGFALFSLTLLLPYSIIPAVGEQILPVLGGAPHLFAWTGLLGVPALAMLFPLASSLKKTEDSSGETQKLSWREAWRAMSGSGLPLIYLACMSFSIMTGQAIFFMKGLCALTGGQSAWFFTTYTVTIMAVRLLGSRILDRLPRYRVMLLCCAFLAACMLGFAWGPLWAFVPLSCVYGVGLGLLYPLLAAMVYDRSSPAMRSINSNVMMSTFDASSMLAPLLGGMVIHMGFGYRGVFAGTAVAMTVCCICVLADRFRLRRSSPQ